MSEAAAAYFDAQAALAEDTLIPTTFHVGVTGGLLDQHAVAVQVGIDASHEAVHAASKPDPVGHTATA